MRHCNSKVYWNVEQSLQNLSKVLISRKILEITKKLLSFYAISVLLYDM